MRAVDRHAVSVGEPTAGGKDSVVLLSGTTWAVESLEDPERKTRR